MKERIQKILGNAGVASRRNIEEMIRQGRISVNGQVRVDLPLLVDPAKDRIEVDGEHVKLAKQKSADRIYILLNKPKGVHTTMVAQGEQLRVIDLLPPDVPSRVYPVGRLDAESRGIVLLTNDGDLTHTLTHPRFGVPKTYRAVVDGYVTGETMQKLGAGVWLGDPGMGTGFKTGRAQMKVVTRSRVSTVLEITMREGRNLQVRRMLARVGHKVRDLTRIKMGPLTLQGIPPGSSRLLTPREVRQLRNLGKPREKEDAATPT